jgi:hypothetical protein
MSSERNGSKPESQEPGPPSGTATRLSAPAPSTWGAARDALAAVHNLDALLRSIVAYKTILDLLPELRTSAGVLFDAFDVGRAGEDEATRAVSAYGTTKVSELEKLLDATASRDEPRGELARRARALAGELEAATDLLALLERASSPVKTEVSVDLIVRETGRMFSSGRGREIAVRFDEGSPDVAVSTDPYVVGPLLTLLVASVSAGGVETITVRTRFEASRAAFVVEASREGDDGLPTVALRVMPAVPPTAAAARRVADQIGAKLELEPTRGSLALAHAGG